MTSLVSRPVVRETGVDRVLGGAGVSADGCP